MDKYRHLFQHEANRGEVEKLTWYLTSQLERYIESHPTKLTNVDLIMVAHNVHRKNYSRFRSNCRRR